MTSLPDTVMQLLDTEATVPVERLGDYNVDGIVPDAAVAPGNVEGVSQVLGFASSQGKRVIPWGGGTQMALGNEVTGADLVLGLSRLNHVIFHEPADLVASFEAGVTLAAAQEELGRQGQFLPLEAPIASKATIGGILASNASGPSRLAYGTARDWLIGIKVVQANGTVTKSGGRVVKNVTGYDLNKLYIGSLGTLGVIVEATFKLVPLPPDSATLVVPYASLSAALDCTNRLLEQRLNPQALLAVNREVLSRLPVPELPAASEAAVLVRLSGTRVAVRRKVHDSTQAIQKGVSGAVAELSGGPDDDLWRIVTDIGWEEQSIPCLAIKVSLLPSQVAEFLANVESGSATSWRMGAVADPGYGLVRLLWWPVDSTSADIALIESTMSAIREAEGLFPGHAVVERCPPELKSKIDAFGDSVEGLDIMRRVKRELDPAGTLNPGRFAGRI